MKLSNIIKLMAILPVALTSCDDMFEPNIENNRTFDVMLTEPINAQGLLMTGYSKLNDQNTFYSYRIHEDLATSDFITNTEDDEWVLMGRGSWKANNNPIDKWNDVRQSIQYLNLLFQNVETIKWANDPVVNQMFVDRLKGESYGLRGLLNYFFLRAHAGYVDGQLYGIPLVTEPETVDSDFNLPRATFQECINQIMSDFDLALQFLPLEYNDIAQGEVPEKYKSLGVSLASDYNRVFGSYMRGRLNGKIIEALKSQVALMAASPAYAQGCDITWEDAANLANTVINHVGGVSAFNGVLKTGNTWYCNVDDIESIKDGWVPDEVIWRGDHSGSDDISIEELCYPPTLYGSGRYNPTQNLVDAFPMANGYPITEAESGYDATNPYSGRDPRLDLYIIHDGSVFKDVTITTASDADNSDGLGKESGKSSKTGYYLKKFMIEAVNPNPSAKNGKWHYKARIRYTEIFLNYAEAANEAWGPTSNGSGSCSAYDVVKAIRQRAGIVNDLYLESIKNDKDKMRQLIHNERRIELMGENFRFWDIRRWKDPINEEIYGINILSKGTKTYTPFSVGKTSFYDYMYYGPIPESEVLKWTNLKQNDGWQ